MVGNQWYWMYTTCDSSLYLYAVREHELSVGDLRLLAVTQCVVVDAEHPLVLLAVEVYSYSSC